MNFENQTVIVTGASRGIGRGIALAFGKAKASVLVNYYSRSKEAEEVVREIEAKGGKAVSFKGDMSDPAQVDAMVSFARDTFGHIDILVNNAGIPGPSKPLIDTTVEEWDRVLGVNLRGYYLCCRAVLPEMLQRRKGNIINIASIYGKRGEPNNAAYCASKAGNLLLTQTLALEVAPHVRVNAICPGHMATEQNWQEIQKWAEERGTSFEIERDRLWETIPLKRPGEDEEIGRLAMFLASDDADYITGASIDIDGGFSVRFCA